MPAEKMDLRELIGDLTISIFQLQKELAAEKQKVEKLSAALADALKTKEGTV